MERKLFDYALYGLIVFLGWYVSYQSNSKVVTAFLIFIFTFSLLAQRECRRYFLDPKNLEQEKMDAATQDFLEMSQKIKKN